MARRRRRFSGQRNVVPNLRLPVRSTVSKSRWRALTAPSFVSVDTVPLRHRVGLTVKQRQAALWEAIRSAPVVKPQHAPRWQSPSGAVVGAVKRKKSVCEARKGRKEVLFAMGRVGRGSAKGKRRPKSEVTC